ncbi:tripartite-type tricarboxylate transporter receptor subunit TctC [Variovorax paradoxus]|uniref:Tripartite-type tricarboxylate transporter receptor subunit TctC n=1 Tax=Variovorax paradoxus TaxID=34073 RepID=A0AAW8E9W9_VARPD|nr:tripartite tricarboxylate transporter substrate binding protein [Variovorax paradoxus]MDP9968917.1 tripartite-type tricarboxylate transporter receptor subunit TctC [Variovorax paradoxus]
MLSHRHLAVAAACLLLAVSAAAQTYPARPVRIVVPYAPGGSTDLIARLVAEPLGRALGQAVVIDNKGGAGGMLGTAEVARAAPDGYTLGVGTVSTMVIFPALHPKPGYTIDQFVPVTNIGVMPNVIAVNPKFPAKDLKEFIAVLKANPDKYTFATSGKGSINHMLGESFQAGAGVKITHVPYRGSGPAMQDVVAGQVDILIDQLPSSKNFIDTGKLRLMGVISPKRVAEYPNVMTMEEVGIKGFNDQAWYGVVAPAKTPPAVLATLSQAMNKVMAMPEVRARLEKAGATPFGNSSAEYSVQIGSEIEAMRTLAKVRNISLEE